VFFHSGPQPPAQDNVQRFRGSEVQRLRGAEVLMYRVAEVQVQRRCTGAEAGLQICR